MDGEINDLIEMTSAYKGDYLKAQQEAARLEAENKAQTSTIQNLKNGYDGLQTILSTTQRMLDLTKEQYSEQLQTNTMMRSQLSELYNIVAAPTATQLDGNGHVKSMTPETQMLIVQQLSRVLKADKAQAEQ